MMKDFPELPVLEASLGNDAFGLFYSKRDASRFSEQSTSICRHRSAEGPPKTSIRQTSNSPTGSK
jgi:hypothetical protein